MLGRWDPDRVVREYAPAVMRHLYRIFGPTADLDDVFQNVFIEVLRSLPRFEGRSKMSTWIRRITWNVAYQEMRVSYRRPPSLPLDETLISPELTSSHDSGDAEDALDRRRTMRKLYAGLAALEPTRRMPVVMHDIEGMTLREVSEALGRPLSTVASQLYAGRATLTEQIRGDCARPTNRTGKQGNRRRR